MPTLDQLEAFITAVEQGSFSAAARRLGKAQSAVSTAVSNLEIETGVTLFDRTTRSPVVTPAGQALLEDARSILRGQHEFTAHASALSKNPESRLCIAIEQSIGGQTLLPLLKEFEAKFPFIVLQLLDPGGSDVADLVRDNRADIGVMIEQEIYPKGFNFRGVGHSRLITVCHPHHPLVEQQPVHHSHLRQFRQLVPHGGYPDDPRYRQRLHSPRYWLSESPHVILDLICSGFGWAQLHEAVVAPRLDNGELVALELTFQQSPVLQGVDVVWTENRPLGRAGHWLLSGLQRLDFSQP